MEDSLTIVVLGLIADLQTVMIKFEKYQAK
jgi:hypothetical protein